MGAAGVLLVGGRSTRMGQPKAALRWHGQAYADRIARILARATRGPVVVVAAAGQEPPALPPEATLVTDANDDRGPLEGIAAGLRALPDASHAYVSSTDVPLLHPAFVEHVIGALEPSLDAVVCKTDGHLHPLAAAYRSSTLGVIEQLLEDGKRRPIELFEQVNTRVLERETLLSNSALASRDNRLDSLMNVNTPEDHERVSALEQPLVDVELLGVVRRDGSPARCQTRAATLGALASAAGVALDAHVVAALNGEQITGDPGLPLVAGDHVALFSADGGG